MCPAVASAACAHGLVGIDILTWEAEEEGVGTSREMLSRSSAAVLLRPYSSAIFMCNRVLRLLLTGFAERAWVPTAATALQNSPA